MLQSISWALYTQAVLVLAIGYYSVIGLLFYRREIARALRRRKE